MLNNISSYPNENFTCSCWCCWGCFAPTGDETRNRCWNKAVALPSTLRIGREANLLNKWEIGRTAEDSKRVTISKIIRSDRKLWRESLVPHLPGKVVRFYQRCSPHPPSPPPPPPLPPPPVSPRPCLHQLPRPLPPCQLVANLVANFREQWALLDLNCWLPIWVGTAGPQPPGSERSGHRWTPTARFWAQWAPLDLNCRLPSPVGTAGPPWDLQSSVGTAGPQPGTFRAQRAAR